MGVTVGVLLNPIAGFGGTLALHGTDELPASRFDDAVHAGRAERRLIRAIESFLAAGGEAELVAAPGILGWGALSATGIPVRSLSGYSAPRRTRGQDTRTAARALLAAGVDVLIFAGGDGTATDIANAIGTEIPVVGVPSGVKMHSQVFARSPEGAGRLLAHFSSGRAIIEPADVLDVDCDGGTGVIAALLVPIASEPLQGAKTVARPRGSALVDGAIARELVGADDHETTWIIGPGTTAAAVAEHLGFASTLRGVDARHPSGAIEQDLTEERLHAIVVGAQHPRLVLGVVGGQGFLLGRGNQEISPRVVAAVGAQRVAIVATEDKVGALFPPVLLVDFDPEMTPCLEHGDDGAVRPRHPLLGYRRVRTGPGQSTVMKVVDAAA